MTYVCSFTQPYLTQSYLWILLLSYTEVSFCSRIMITFFFLPMLIKSAFPTICNVLFLYPIMLRCLPAPASGLSCGWRGWRIWCVVFSWVSWTPDIWLWPHLLVTLIKEFLFYLYYNKIIKNQPCIVKMTDF